MTSRTRKLIGYGLTSAVIAVGGVEALNLASPDTPTISTSTEGEVEHAFEQNVSFWVARGLGAIATTKLIVVSGNDTYDCPGVPNTAEPKDEVLSARSPSEVCLSNQTVIITPADLTTAPGGVTFTVGHEVGHVVGEVTKQLGGREWDDVHSKIGLAAEESATCYAGIEMNAELPLKIAEVSASIVGDVAEDPIHGTGTEQANAFMKGARANDITACAIDTFLAQNK